MQEPADHSATDVGPGQSGDVARQRVAALLIDAGGMVTAANQVARRLLGEVVGLRCSAAVGGAQGVEGAPCSAECAHALAAVRGHDAAESRVTINRRACRLTCTTLGGGVAVVLSPASDRAPEPWERLTSREREVVELVAEGLTTQEVAKLLGISHSTARTHVEHVRERLGAVTRAELVARCLRLGLIE